jgi:predicted alpha/beta superfamily hydrolase
MRYTLFALIVAALGLHGVEAEDRPTPVLIGYQTTIQSKVLGEARDVLISLPADYGQPDEAFPVMVLLDGRAHFHHTTAAVQYLSRLGRIPEMIVVGIPNTRRTRDFTSNQGEGLERRDAGGADAFLDFVEHEVLMWVDEEFRTAPYRMLVGHSLGASLACYTLATRPHLFQGYVLFSPAISADERQLPDDATPMTELVSEGLEALDDRPRRLYAAMSGVEDQGWIEDWKRLRRVLRRHAPKEFEWRQEDWPETDHATIPLFATAPALAWLFEGWDGAEAARTDDFGAVEDHYAALSLRMGYPVAPPENLVNTMGYRRLQAGRIDEALVVFRRNVELHPRSANVHDSLGEALEAAGELEAAAESFAAAVERASGADPRLRAVFERNLERVTRRLTESAGS